MSNRSFSIALILVLSISFASCGVNENSQEEDRQELESLKTQIDNIIGDASCTDPAECRVIAFGSKPCGGPWSYLIYSTVDTDTGALASRVELYDRKEDAYNSKWGISSDCMFVSPPDSLICEDGHCVAQYYGHD